MAVFESMDCEKHPSLVGISNNKIIFTVVLRGISSRDSNGGFRASVYVHGQG